MRTYKGLITELPDNGIFVFGSNTEGRHGLGAAKIARQKFGAIYGNPRGQQGRSFAIVTKDLTKKVHPSVNETWIETQIRDLYAIAIYKPYLDFYVAYSGAGKNLNGYSNEEMAKMFSHVAIPENIIFEEQLKYKVKAVKENDVETILDAALSEDLYINKEDYEDVGTLEELKEMWEDDFKLENYRFQPAGIPFLYIEF